MTLAEILRRMKAKANPANVAGMARYGIVAKKAYGLSAPFLKDLAREVGKDHALAQRLWTTGILEARALAGLVDEPERVSEQQAERWVKDFDSWAVCDGICLHLFRKTPFAYRKCSEWSLRSEEFVKRAGFALMACLAVHDKRASDDVFLAFLPLIREAIRTARAIARLDAPSARWIAADALRELASEAVQQRLKRRPH